MTGPRFYADHDGHACVVNDDTVSLDGTVNRALKTGRHRLTFTAVLFVLACAVIIGRLVDLTVISGGFEPRYADTTPVSRHSQFDRRDIVDRNGVVLATNLPTASVYADPRKVLDAAEAAAKLAAVLPELGRAQLEAKLASERHFVWIKRNRTPRQQAAINRLGIPGVGFQREDRRVYPLGRMFAHVLGFADIDNQGIAGIEASFDESLRVVRDGDEDALRLSLDTRFQHVLREELAHGIATFSALGAAGVILDVTSGEVLAMASLPDFDPNDPKGRGGEASFNRATLGAYEMGSTFKLLTAAMALDYGVATMTDAYDASEPLRVARFTIRDYKPKNRWLTIPEIIVYSSNIGAAKLALDVGADGQRDFLSRLGLLNPADIELPEVATPLAPSPWGEISTMTIGFGHGVAVSPLQLASAIAAVVNGGVFHSPTLLVRDPADPDPGRRVVSPTTSAQIRALMRLVVVEGTGKKAAVPGYLVGGKTGTAEKPGSGGYQRKALISSFVAAFPMDAPRYVIIAMFDEPQGIAETFNYATGGWVAAPVVGRIIARIGPMAGIPMSERDDIDATHELLIQINQRKDEGVAF
ncbi:MAG: penicillin-binding protein 2 [Alphaproteobacteria bacterium]